MKNLKFFLMFAVFTSVLITVGCSDSSDSSDSNDPEKLSVVSYTLNDEKDVSVYSSIEFVMSGAINNESINSDSFILTGNDIREYGSAVSDSDSNELVIIPYKPLQENTEYTLTLSEHIRSETGAVLGEDYTITFSTGEYVSEKTGDIRVFCNYESGYARKDLTLTFTTEETDASIQTGWSKTLDATEPDEWTTGDSFAFSQMDSYGTVKIFARIVIDSEPVGDNFSFVYKIMDRFPPVGANTEGYYKDDKSLTAWATSISSYTYGYDVEDKWKGEENQNQVLGIATGNNFDVFVMGNHGELTLAFESGIRDGTGYDLVVFENGFLSEGGAGMEGEIFAELFYVEVSSNGSDFLRFDNVSLTPEPVGGYGTLDTGNVNGLGGLQPNAYRINHYGSPFDLAWLKNKKEVLDGTVDLANITRVKLVDIPGTDGTEGIDLSTDRDGNPIDGYNLCYDSFGYIIRDAFRTWGSGGADIEAIGVIHTIE